MVEKFVGMPQSGSDLLSPRQKAIFHASTSPADIKENGIFAISPKLLNTLLKDHTLSTKECQVNIFWATDNYADRGEGYQYSDKITVESITGDNGNIIVPRALKSRQQQQQRSREMAEDFVEEFQDYLNFAELFKKLYDRRESLFD